MKIFLGGDCSDDNEWRKEVKKAFPKLDLVDPYDEDWEAEENIYNELTDLVKCDHIIFYKGGDGTDKEKDFCDSIKLKYHEFDDLDEVKEFLEDIENVKPNKIKVASKQSIIDSVIN